MDCRRIQDIMQERLTPAGMELPPEVQAHVESCAACRAFYQELAALTARLAPLAEISLSAEESIRLESRLQEAVASLPHKGAIIDVRRKKARIIRLATSVAAVILLVAASITIDFTPEKALQGPLDDLDLHGATIEDIAPLFVNGENDLMPTVIDGESAYYLTEQVGPGQADDIFDNITAEELDWLMKNLSVEI